MINWLKTYWWTALIIAVLCFLLFKGCKAGPSHASDDKTVDSVNAVTVKTISVLTAKNDSLSKIDQAKDKAIDSLIAERLNEEKDLADRGQIIAKTIQNGKVARIDKDTIAIVTNCDSLINEVVSAKAIVTGYESLTDSLIKDEQAQAEVKDSIAANWKSAFLSADTARAITLQKYGSLYTDYNKINRRLKFSGILGKVGAGVIAALAIGLLIKK